MLIPRSLADSYDTNRVIYDSPIGTADHKMLTCVPNCVKVSTLAICWHKVYDLRKSNLHLLARQSNLVDWDAILSNDDDVNTSWNTFYSVLVQLVQLCVPSRTVPITQQDKEWITPITKMLIMDRWSAYQSGNLAKYNRLKEKLKQEINNAKKIWANKLMNTTNGLCCGNLSVTLKRKSIWMQRLC